MNNGFAEIYGNESLKTQLESNIEHDHINHAYMVTGEKGTGKKTFVKAFLMELFCRKKDPVTGEPCFDSAECDRILNNNHPDIINVTHEKSGTISVGEIRTQVVETVGIRPYSSRYKAYVINDAELMTVQAQNAFLKTLEEPPEYVVFILIAADDHALLDTIRSRVTILKLKPLTDSIIRDYLIQKFDAYGEKLEICIAFSRGNLGRAVDLYQSTEFSEWYQRLMRIIKNIKQMDAAQIRIEIAKLRKVCPDLMEALDLLELWYRDLTLYMVTKDMNGLVFCGESKTLMSMASSSTCPGVQEIMERIDVCRKRLKAHVNPDLCLELLFLTMREK